MNLLEYSYSYYYQRLKECTIITYVYICIQRLEPEKTFSLVSFDYMKVREGLG